MAEWWQVLRKNVTHVGFLQPLKTPLDYLLAGVLLYFSRRFRYTPQVRQERWLSGRKRRFAKPLYGLNRTEGSNPSLSAKSIGSQINSRVLFEKLRFSFSSRGHLAFHIDARRTHPVAG